MADADKNLRLYRQWLAAEDAYAQCLSKVTSDPSPGKVKKATALELASLRGTADRARDHYFRKSLK